MCNAELQIHSVLLVGCTPPEFIKMMARSCKIWFGQNSCHLYWLYICFISTTQNKHITFMTIHCNTERWSNVLVIHIKFLMNLSISQKISFQSLDTNICPILYHKHKSNIVSNSCNDVNMIHQHPLSSNSPNIVWSLICFYNILQILHGYWLTRPKLPIR